eukprot:gb/GFBE01017609.1/.p1 GENE.gb/GFBE01017609.1/~~gb/GFBE01017609.1/.p1  ORF type:complete len:394 (+),score=80.75 gb/GFBE01017609.1/:1-1182(+)
MCEGNPNSLVDALASVDACAFLTLERWGESLEMSPDAADCYREMLEAARAAADEEELKKRCIRLRLVARLSKVLRLLSEAPGPRTVKAAKNWAERDVQDATAGMAAFDELLQVRDIALAEGRVSAAAAGNTRTLIRQVLQMAQHLNAQALPRPICEETCSQLRAMLAQRASSSKAADSDEELFRPSKARRMYEPIADPITICSSGESQNSSQATIPAELDTGAAMEPYSAGPTAAEGTQSRKRKSRSPDPAGLGQSFAAPARPVDPGNAPAAAAQRGGPTTSEPRPAQAQMVAHDIFSAPLPGDLDLRKPAEKQIRSEAPVTSDGDSAAAREDVPARIRRYDLWTEQEERRLIEGYRRYGKSWSMIRTTCDLRHRTAIQIKDKWRNLKKAGAA